MLFIPNRAIYITNDKKRNKVFMYSEFQVKCKQKGGKESVK